LPHDVTCQDGILLTENLISQEGSRLSRPDIVSLMKSFGALDDPASASRKIRKTIARGDTDKREILALQIGLEGLRCLGHDSVKKRMVHVRRALSAPLRLSHHLDSDYTLRVASVFANLSEAEEKIIQIWLRRHDTAWTLKALRHAPDLPEHPDYYVDLDAHRPVPFSGDDYFSGQGGFAIYLSSPMMLETAIHLVREYASPTSAAVLVLSESCSLSPIEHALARSVFDFTCVATRDLTWSIPDGPLRQHYFEVIEECRQTIHSKRNVLDREIVSYLDYHAHSLASRKFGRFASIVRQLQQIDAPCDEIVFFEPDLARSFNEKNSVSNLVPAKTFYYGGHPAHLSSKPYKAFYRARQYLENRQPADRRRDSPENDRSKWKASAGRLKTVAKSLLPSRQRRLVIFVHPGDKQYLITAREICRELPAGSFSVVSSRDLTPNERLLLGDIQCVSIATLSIASENVPAVHFDNIYAGSFENTQIKNTISQSLGSISGLSRGVKSYLAAGQFSHALFIPERPEVFKLALDVAQQQGIRTANVAASSVGRALGLGRYQADRHFVVDHSQKLVFERVHHISSRQIAVVGSCVSYSSGNLPTNGIDEAAFRLKKHVLICTQSDSLDSNLAMVQGTIEGLKIAKSSLSVVIRPHPTEAKSPQRLPAYSRELEKSGLRGKCSIDANTSLTEILSSARYVVSRYSTVLNETRGFDAIPICANFLDEQLPIDLFEIGYCLGVRSPEQLADLIEQEGTSFESERMMRGKFAAPHGNPARATLEAFLK
jgi:hypothetical protein